MTDTAAKETLQKAMIESVVNGVAKDVVHALVQEAIEKGGEISFESVKEKWEARALARARLNDAAPDLLAALEQLVGACHLNSSSYLMSCKRDALIVIARARGEAC